MGSDAPIRHAQIIRSLSPWQSILNSKRPQIRERRNGVLLAIASWGVVNSESSAGQEWPEGPSRKDAKL